MFCKSCGTENKDGVQFCKECGESLGSTIPPGQRVGSAEADTVFEGKGAAAPPPPVPLPVLSSDRERMQEKQLPKHQSSAPPGVKASPAEPRTVFQSGGEDASNNGGRRIIGVLITYTWKPEGQLFPIREGRNLIGRDPKKCEIAFPHDPALSEINSHITYRSSFVIGDMVSMNGTFLNGSPVETQFVPLNSSAQVRCGSTECIFVAIPAKEMTNS